MIQIKGAIGVELDRLRLRGTESKALGGIILMKLGGISNLNTRKEKMKQSEQVVSKVWEKR